MGLLKLVWAQGVSMYAPSRSGNGEFPVGECIPIPVKAHGGGLLPIPIPERGLIPTGDPRPRIISSVHYQ
jgi:hypothetical protein